MGFEDCEVNNVGLVLFLTLLACGSWVLYVQCIQLEILKVGFGQL